MRKVKRTTAEKKKERMRERYHPRTKSEKMDIHTPEPATPPANGVHNHAEINPVKP